MAFRSFFTGMLALSLGVAAIPNELFGRAECNRDNLFRCLIDQRYSVQASAYCSNLSPFTTTAAIVTATSYQTYVTTVVASTQTKIVTSTTTLTLPAQGKSNSLTPSYTTIIASTPSVAPPSCVTNGASYPASRITSACSCISVPASTTNVTFTAATTTIIVSNTELISITTTVTARETVTKFSSSLIPSTTTTSQIPSPTPSACYGFTDGSCSGRYRIACDTHNNVASGQVLSAITAADCEAYCNIAAECIGWDFHNFNGDIQCYWRDARAVSLGTEEPYPGIVLGKVDASCGV